MDGVAEDVPELTDPDDLVDEPAGPGQEKEKVKDDATVEAS
jgi:hypothetical protein